jgi:hypothetical protein
MTGARRQGFGAQGRAPQTGSAELYQSPRFAKQHGPRSDYTLIAVLSSAEILGAGENAVSTSRLHITSPNSLAP